MGGLFIFISLASHLYGLNGIKSKTVGNGQHGTARWASKGEIDKTYTRVNYEPQKWRTDEKSRPKAQGIVVGCETVGKKQTIGLVDTGDVHCMMIGAAGVGKTAFWLYPNIEYACASGMSFMSTDTKGDIMRNYGSIASKYYGYNISVIDLRNPMRSHGNNLLHLVNKYMDLYTNTTLFDKYRIDGVEHVVDGAEYNEPSEIMLQTTHKDVVLDFFKNKKEIIFNLRSGTKLKLDDVYLVAELNGRDVRVAKLSKAFAETLEKLKDKGYSPKSAEVRFVVAWKGEEDTEETPIILADMHFVK